MAAKPVVRRFVRPGRARSPRSPCAGLRKIEHSMRDSMIFSCDHIRLRVKSVLKFGCSISLINKRRSITELNPDSRTKHFIVKHNRRLASRTLRFCGSVPPPKSPASPLKSSTVLLALRLPFSSADAGVSPAFPHAPALRAAVARRRTEFISVSGLCPERSALHSVQRPKRSTGSAAASELPHAPMNSPDAFAPGFLLNLPAS